MKIKGKFLLAVLFVSLLPGPLAGQDADAVSQEACDGGDMLSCHALGLRYEAGVVVIQDLARAVRLFQQACDGAMMLGCTHVGLMYQNGRGVSRDLASAAFLYDRACDGGEMLGCANLGVSYERGDGVTQDGDRAVSLYEQACGGDEMLGCTNLGSMYRMGTGVTQDFSVAFSLYWRACENGMMMSCVNLAVSYERGDGVAQDVATAVRLYLRACGVGITLACNRIGVTYEPDAGVAPTNEFARVGWVADTESRDPLSEAIVDIRDIGVRVITDASGRVEFGELPAGRYRLKVERVGYQAMEGDLDVPGDREFLLLLDRTTIGDLTAPGRVIGRVLEGGRNYGVAGVEITVLTPTPVNTLSGPQGRFNLTGVEPGLVEVRFERLGYATRTATVIVQPDNTIEIAASMSTQPIELDPIVVVVRSRALERNGFYQRALVGSGHQMARDDLEGYHLTLVTDVFRRVPGVRAEGGQILGRQTGFGNTCQLRIFVDGLPADGWDIDSIPPEYLEAMEVYQGLAVPIQYGPSCGVVLIWLR